MEPWLLVWEAFTEQPRSGGVWALVLQAMWWKPGVTMLIRVRTSRRGEILNYILFGLGGASLLIVAKYLEFASNMFSCIWWIVGFYCVSAGGQALIRDAPQLYWLCIVFLAFDSLVDRFKVFLRLKSHDRSGDFLTLLHFVCDERSAECSSLPTKKGI
ncbi:hypothetical protein C4D60_Mb10t21090 [Musa balbisiana]|uniref:Uncharacterized protein n=1 Tax=Musa balbisiana TaxID=52838 RepID=A0A4S8J042_MUSBA|nr:hypothetical protein C4D60_Mb10t21090 [Musa balbisiana]